MDRYTLENNDLVVEISPLGAELKRIYGKRSGIEYLWQGSEEFWNRSATLLFPFVGRLDSGKYRYNGNEYDIPCHGFAKDTLFEIKDSGSEHIIFTSQSNESTQNVYPFDFSLEVEYTLSNMCIKENVRVTNTASSDMLFKIGFHPGFNVPLEEGLSFEDYSIAFGGSEIEKRVLSSDKRLDLGYSISAKEIHGNVLKLDHSLFADDALVLSNTGGKARLASSRSEHYVELLFDAPWCGIWQTYSDKTPFVAIEPWYNLPGHDGKIEDLDRMLAINKLEGDSSKEFSLTIKLG